MKKSGRLILITIFLSTFTTLSVSATDFSDVYNYIMGVFGTTGSQNTGLTVFPTLLIPSGGQAEGMGSAYTAVGRDLSYLDSNPASSSGLAYTEFGVLHKNLIADANLESLMYTTRIDNLGLGAGLKFLYVPFTGYGSYGQQLTTFRYTETVATLNASYNFLHGFYFNGISAGANIKVAYRGEPNVTGLIQDQSAFGFMGDFGLLTRFDLLKFYPSRTRNFAIGVTAKNFGPPVLNEPLPSMLSAGVSYSPLRPLLFAFDFNYPVSLLPNVPAESYWFASGMSVQFTDFFATEAGFQLKGGDPRVTLGADVQLSNFALHVNYILDMTTQLGAVDNFSIEMSFDLGDGGRAARTRAIETTYLNALDALAGGDLTRTIQLCRQILAKDSSFDPARETLNNALKSEDLQRQMDALRKPTTPSVTGAATPSTATPSGGSK